MEKETVQSNNLMHGISGAILGSIVCALPWILVYAIWNHMWTILAIIIAVGAYYGYKLFKGPLDKRVPIVVTTVTVAVILITIFFIIPLIYVVKFDESLAELYNEGNFIRGLVSGSYFSILFTFAGIAGILAFIRKDLGLEFTSKK